MFSFIHGAFPGELNDGVGGSCPTRLHLGTRKEPSSIEGLGESGLEGGRNRMGFSRDPGPGR